MLCFFAAHSGLEHNCSASHCVAMLRRLAMCENNGEWPCEAKSVLSADAASL